MKNSLHKVCRNTFLLMLPLLYSGISHAGIYGTITCVEGNVTVGGDSAVIGSLVYSGNSVITDIGAKACISFNDNSLVQQSAETEIVFDEYYDSDTDEYDVALRVLDGLAQWTTGDGYIDDGSTTFGTSIDRTIPVRHRTVSRNQTGSVAGTSLEVTADTVRDGQFGSYLRNAITLRSGGPINVYPVANWNSFSSSLFTGTFQDLRTMNMTAFFEEAKRNSMNLSQFLSVDQVSFVALATVDHWARVNRIGESNLIDPVAPAPAYNPTLYAIPAPEPSQISLVGAGLLIWQLQRRRQKSAQS